MMALMVPMHCTRLNALVLLLVQDIDTIFLSQETKELTLSDFDHLDAKLVRLCFINSGDN